jgi:3-hydroxy-9,10-secoandrosta-1,3,5(10)-triene-9,17-dione monooxygenase
MTRTEPIPFDAAVVAQARDLVPLLRAEAAETERRGRLTDASAAALRSAGFFTLHSPRSLGGHEAGLRTAVEVHRELARGDGSSAWVAMLLSGAGLLASMLGDRGRSDVWGEDPTVGVCASFTPQGSARRVPGGLALSGRWETLSGIHQAGWAALATPVVDGSGAVEDMVVAVVPLDAVTVEPTWQVTGMQGTGSDSLSVDDLVVPDHRVLALEDVVSGSAGVRRPTEPLQAAPLVSWMVPAHVAIVLGMAEAALEHVQAGLAAGRPVATSVYTDARESPGVQAQMAEATYLVDTARLALHRSVALIEDALAQGVLLDDPARALVRMDAAASSTGLRRALDLLLDAGGARSFALHHPVQRIWRDLNVTTRHPVLAPALNQEVFGRSVLGLEEQVVDLV